jgi:hypothetical protein
MATVPVSNHKRLIFIISSIGLGALIGIAVFTTFFGIKTNRGNLIVSEIAQLADIFKRIHKTAVIKSFDATHNVINFLNVKSFAGSEVGPMNIAYPDKWEGNYLPDNLTIQSKEYEVIRNTNGMYYIVPGQGVRLPNGKVMGKDVVLDEASDIESLMAKGGDLNFEGQPMAAVIDVRQQALTLPAELIE